MRGISVLVVLAFICFPGCEQRRSGGAPVALLNENINMGNRYQINKDGSFINFKTTMGGFPVIKGAVKGYQATLFYDPEDVMSTSATIRLSTDGFTTAHDQRDTELHGEHFLHSAKYPAIWFQGTDVSPRENPDDGFDLSGTINIKEITKPVTVHMKKPILMPGAMNQQNLMIVEGNFKFKRSDFNLGTTGEWVGNQMLGEEIEVTFSFMCFSYTIEYLKAAFTQNGEHPVGMVYSEVKKNGVENGLELVKRLSKDERYKSDDWPGHLANIGWILMVDGFGTESLPFYQSALDQNSRHLPSLLRLGDAYTIAGQYENALAHFEEELSLSARARFTHIPHMIKLLSNQFELKNMK